MARLLKFKGKVVMVMIVMVALVPVFGKGALIVIGIGAVVLQGVNREVDGLNG